MSFNKADWKQIREDFSTIQWSDELNKDDINDICEKFEEIVINTTQKYTPRHECRRKNPQSTVPMDRRRLHRQKRRQNQKINILKYINPCDLSQSTKDRRISELNRLKLKVESEINDSIKLEKLKKEETMLKKFYMHTLKGTAK